VSREPEFQKRTTAESAAAPVPALSLEYERGDAGLAGAARRFGNGLLLMAIPFGLAVSLYAFAWLSRGFRSNRQFLSSYYAFALTCELSFLAGGWIVLGFDRTGRRQVTVAGRFGQCLLVVGFAIQVSKVVYWTRVFPIFFTRARYLGLMYLGDICWTVVSAVAIVYAARRLKAFPGGGFGVALSALTVVRGICVVASNLCAYVYTSQLYRSGRPFSGPPRWYWQICGLTAVALGVLMGMAMLGIVRGLRRGDANTAYPSL
jgi:hypothetical protein